MSPRMIHGLGARAQRIAEGTLPVVTNELVAMAATLKGE